MSRYPNRVAMAPHGLILSQDGATASRNLFKYLPAPGEGPRVRVNVGKVRANVGGVRAPS